MLAALVGMAPSASAVTRDQAASAALRVLKVKTSTGPVIVFGLRNPVARGTKITQYGTAMPVKAVRRPGRTGRQQVRNAAGVGLARLPLVERVGPEPTWFFYADLGPYQGYRHPGRVVLVGARSGEIVLSASIQWPPLVGGKLPSFLARGDLYRDPRYRVFVRDWSLPGAVRATAPPAASAAVADPAALRKAHDRLLAERSCFVRLSDTTGVLYDHPSVQSAEAALTDFFDRLGLFNPSNTYRYGIFSGTTPSGYIQRLINRQGCREVLVFVAGGGFRDVAAINIGNRALPSGMSEQQNLTAAELRRLIAANPSVTFNVKLDAPFSGSFLAGLRGLSNLRIFESAVGATQISFEYVPAVDGLATAAQGQSLAFTQRQVAGLERFLADPREVDHAVAAIAIGRAPSFMTWMLARGFALGQDQDRASQLGYPPLIETFGFTADGPPAPPVTPVNRPPVADDQSVATDEDTAKAITLTGSDPDGDPVSFTVTGGPSHGTLSGAGASRTYVPDANYAGSDSFTFVASDGSATSTPATASITVSPVNDAPGVDLDGGASGGIDNAVAFTAGGGPVDLASGALVTDPDDTDLESGAITLTNRPDLLTESLSVDTTGTSIVAGPYNPLNGELTLTGSDTLAHYQQVIQSARYDNSAAIPDPTSRVVSFVLSDGAASSPVATATVTVS